MSIEHLEEFPYESAEYHAHVSAEVQATLRRLPIEFHLIARKI